MRYIGLYFVVLKSSDQPGSFIALFLGTNKSIRRALTKALQSRQDHKKWVASFRVLYILR